MYSKIFEYAKQKGLTGLELYIVENEEVEIGLFHGEIDNYKVSKVKNISARGVVNGKMGYASSEKYDGKTAKYLVDAIIKNANLVTSTDKAIIYEGDKEYQKVNVYNEQLHTYSMTDKINLLKEVEAKALAYHPSIVEVADNIYAESTEVTTIINDKGLNLSRKNNQFQCYVSVVAKEDSGNKDGSYFIFDNDFSKLSADKIVKEACEDALSKLGAAPVKSGEYKVVLDAKMTASLIGQLLGNVFASTVQDGMSRLKDKLGERIGNELVTIIEDPLKEDSIISTPFDDEGVATYKKTIVDKGILKMFVYNLKRALKDDVKSTGNGYRSGGIVNIGLRNAYLQGGSKSKDELFKQVGNGVYITELAGLHSGLDPVSGNFSLQAGGFVIKDGLKDRPVNVITVAGNLFDILNDIEELGSDLDCAFSPNIKAPSVILKKITIAGL